MKTRIQRYLPAVLGLFFIYSGSYKLFRPGEATAALMALGWSPGVSMGTITTITSIELYLGLILFLKLDLKYALIAATLLMFAFTGFLWYLSTQAHPPSCGCMGFTGVFKSNKEAAIFGIARNCVVLLALKIAYESHFGEVASPPQQHLPATAQ